MGILSYGDLVAQANGTAPPAAAATAPAAGNNYAALATQAAPASNFVLPTMPAMGPGLTTQAPAAPSSFFDDMLAHYLNAGENGGGVEVGHGGGWGPDTSQELGDSGRSPDFGVSTAGGSMI